MRKVPFTQSGIDVGSHLKSTVVAVVELGEMVLIELNTTGEKSSALLLVPWCP